MHAYMRLSRVFPALLLLGCSLDVAPPVDEFLFAQMNGANMRPEPTLPTAGNGTFISTAIVSMPRRGNSLTYDIDLNNVEEATSVTLHIGGTAVVSPPIATLYSNPEGLSGSGKVVVARPLTNANLTGVTVDSLLSAIREGNAYTQLQTIAFPNGAMRAQILPFDVSPPPERYSAAPMNGANERPNPVTTTATGEAHFEFGNEVMTFLLTATNITGVTAAHIHSGGPNVAGPIVMTLFSPSVPTGAVDGTLANGIFSVTDVGTMQELLLLMRTGNAYVNVHTTANPDGEIRATIAPVNFTPPIP